MKKSILRLSIKQVGLLLQFKKILLITLALLSIYLIIGLYWQKQKLNQNKSTTFQFLLQIEKGKNIDLNISDLEFYFILQELSKEPFRPHIKNILKGANIELIDKGAYYFIWKDSSFAYQRISSHDHKANEAYAISHLLFWRDKKGNTRFQVEKTPLKGFFYSVFHAIDYLYYISTKKQQGIIGDSSYIENQPYKILIKDEIIPLIKF